MNKGIYILATFWNEIEWINVSLKQLDIMNAEKIIICDGCYDSRKTIHSTDGTYEIIKDFARQHNNVILIEPIRQKRINHLWDWMKQKNRTKKFRLFGRLFNLYLILKSDTYRLNQARTFNEMLNISKIKSGEWFTTYDCDQFYSDELIEKLSDLSMIKGNIIVGKEYTFFGDFKSFTKTYEKRDYNNMPHKYFDDLFFLPTRQPVRIYKGNYKVCSDIYKQKEDGGIIYHYKIKSKQRTELTYQVGDRKPPIPERMITSEYNGKHPRIIEENLDKLSAIQVTKL